MNAYWKKFQAWWAEATPKKRWTAIGLTVGVVCSILFFLVTESSSGSSTVSQSVADRMDSPLYYVGAAAKTIGVLLLIVGGAVILKRMQAKQSRVHNDKNLQIVETVRITPKQAIHLVRAGNQCFLVGATDQTLNLISQVEIDGQKIEETQPHSLTQPSFDSFMIDATELMGKTKAAK